MFKLFIFFASILGAVSFVLFVAIIGMLIFSYSDWYGLEMILNPKGW